MISWRIDPPTEATHCIVTARVDTGSEVRDVAKAASWFRGSWRDTDLRPLPWRVLAWAPWPEPFAEPEPFDLEAEASLAQFFIDARINARHTEARTAIAEHGLRAAEQIASRVELEFARIGIEHDLPMMERYSQLQIISLRVFLGLSPINMEHAK